MLDIKFIRENIKIVENSLKKRGVKFDLAKLLDLDQKRIALIGKRDQARSEQKQSFTGGKFDPKEAKKLKSKFQKLDKEESDLAAKIKKLIISLPNILDEEVPAGGEEKNTVVRTGGKKNKLNFTPKDHLELGEKLGLLDFERGAKVSGSRFYFIKGDLAQLSRAIVSFALDILETHGFLSMIPPHIVREEMIWGKGLLSKEEIDLNVYKLEEEDKYLIGTGEIPLTGYHADEVIRETDMPLKYCALTTCYRKEAGTYGKHAKGLFRVHQFEKLEMYQYVNESQSEVALDEFVRIEEKILEGLGLPYRIVLVAGGDMAGYLYKQFDAEYWSPVDNTYREIMSAGNARDFQSRRLNIRYKNTDGKLVYLHTLNATAAATSRLLIAIMENYQTADGKIMIPKVLQKYMGGKEMIG